MTTVTTQFGPDADDLRTAFDELISRTNSLFLLMIMVVFLVVTLAIIQIAFAVFSIKFKDTLPPQPTKVIVQKTAVDGGSDSRKKKSCSGNRRSGSKMSAKSSKKRRISKEPKRNYPSKTCKVNVDYDEILKNRKKTESKWTFAGTGTTSVSTKSGSAEPMQKLLEPVPPPPPAADDRLATAIPPFPASSSFPAAVESIPEPNTTPRIIQNIQLSDSLLQTPTASAAPAPAANNLQLPGNSNNLQATTPPSSYATPTLIQSPKMSTAVELARLAPTFGGGAPSSTHAFLANPIIGAGIPTSSVSSEQLRTAESTSNSRK